MSNCIRNCKLCDKLILSQSISFNATVNQIIIDLPAGAYGNGEKYCLVFAQSIPTNATLNAQVVFTIGGDQTVGYPFLNKNCAPVYASQIKSRRVYPVKVNTNVTPGVFKYVGNNCLPEAPFSGPGSIPTT